MVAAQDHWWPASRSANQSHDHRGLHSIPDATANEPSPKPIPSTSPGAEPVVNHRAHADTLPRA